MIQSETISNGNYFPATITARTNFLSRVLPHESFYGCISSGLSHLNPLMVNPSCKGLDDMTIYRYVGYQYPSVD